jgi:hypothetical protein
MTDLRIPKLKTQVDLVLEGGQRRAHHLFCSEFAPVHAGRERVSDLLNGEVDFLPAQDGETGTFFLLNRRHLVVAHLAAELERTPHEEHTIPTEFEVELSLTHGGPLTGLLVFVRPTESSRLVDFFNDPELFFRLHQGDTVALINKRHVVRLKELRR